MFETNARGILLDIEGTTSSISFVYDVMFPFVRKHVAAFLGENWELEPVQESVAMLAEDLEEQSVKQWLSHESAKANQDQVVNGVIGLMDADRKATGLKQLQGLIWKDGFESGDLVAHLFDEVADCIERWHESGIDVRIYSSGSIQAQKLFFGHTVAGDLTHMLNAHYDTTTGAKRDPESYRRIASEFDCRPDQILFVSDVIAELAAAKTAGLETVLSVRPGNHPIEEQHDFASITRLDQIRNL